MLITVITVCFNAEQFIENTMQSVLNQTKEEIEYIIKDGKSTDRTNEIVENYRARFEQKGNSLLHLVREDSGIYDAMNQALENATGQYVYFLNAGDYFVNNYVLRDVESFVSKTNADVVYGDIVQIDGRSKKVRKYGKACSKKVYFLSGDCICHQAIFAQRKLFEKKKFDLTYRVCADKEWQLSQIAAGKSFQTMKFEIAAVLVEGFSANHVLELEEETKCCVAKYCKRMAWVYNMVDYMKHNAIGVKLLRAVGNVCFVRKRS